MNFQKFLFPLNSIKVIGHVYCVRTLYTYIYTLFLCYLFILLALKKKKMLIRRVNTVYKIIFLFLPAGTEDEINAALRKIREKFPPERFPNVTLSQICFLPFMPCPENLMVIHLIFIFQCICIQMKLVF